MLLHLDIFQIEYLVNGKRNIVPLHDVLLENDVQYVFEIILLKYSKLGIS